MKKRLFLPIISLLLALTTPFISYMFLNQVRFQNAIVLELNETYFVNIYTPGLKVFFKFTPPSTRSYSIRSVGGKDTYLTLYDDNYSFIILDDDSGLDLNFYLARTLYQNTNYFLEVRLYSFSATGSFNVILT